MVKLEKIKRFLVVGEKNMFRELSQIISIASETNTILKKMLDENYEEQTLVKDLDKVRSLEKKSDNIAIQIGKNVTSGAVSPNVIDDLLQCIELADDIVDNYYYLSRELTRIAKTQSTNLKEYQTFSWKKLYQTQFDLAEESFQKLKRMFLTSDEKELSRLRSEIESLEEKGDEEKDQGFDMLYRMAPNISYLQFYHFSELLHKCDDILDSSQGLSQLIVTIVISILK